MTDVTKLKEQEAKAILNDQRMRAVLECVSSVFWEFNLQSNSLSLSSVTEQGAREIKIIKHMPDALVSLGIVHSDSISDYISEFKKIDKGCAKGAFVIKVKFKGAPYAWHKIYYSVVSDDEGRAVTVIGTCIPVSDVSDIKSEFDFERMVQEVLTDRVGAVSIINVSKNRIEKLVSSFAGVRTDWLADSGSLICTEMTGESKAQSFPLSTIEDLLAVYDRYIVDAAQRKLYRSIFSRTALMESFLEGERLRYCEFQTAGAGGRIKWNSTLAVLITDPISGDLYYLGYARDIDTVKKRNLSFPEKIYFDSTYLVYKSYSAKRISKYLRQRDGYTAMAVVEIVNLDRVKDFYGSKRVMSIRKEMSVFLSVFMRATDIVCCIEEKFFAVVMPDVPSKSYPSEEIHKFMELVSKDPAFFNAKYSLKFAVGIDVVPSNDFDFDVSYGKIRNVCRMTSSDEQIYQINQLGTEKETDCSSSFCQEYGDVHSQHNLNLYLESINTLKHEHDYDKKINELLAVMGRFFKADRTYVFTVHDSVWADCLHEWSRRGIKPIMKSMSNINIPSEEPIFYKSITSGEIITASAGEYETEEVRSFMEGRGIKRLVVVPIDITDGRSGLLGIENSSENLDNMGVLNTLSYMIASEERKLFFKKRDEYILYHDEMTGLLNGNSYRDQLMRIDRDALSTLGVMCLDINGLKSINSKYGMDYGDSIVSHCSLVLRRYFSENEVFRLFGDEFRIICPDMERSSFVRCTEKVIEDVNSFMNEAAESGWAWSDGEIDPDSLMLAAEEIMSVRKKEYYRKSGKVSEADHTRMYETLMSDIDNGAYIMYLQPKVEISTGKICGAEALVRAYYPDRGIIPPAKFIEPLEKENLIHFIDFFMFEEVCKILAKWIKLGCLDMTVSVNFSRLTLLCPETPNKIKSLCSTYSVPNNMIEIEVTETLGSISESSIKEVTEQIARDGFSIALDDFGARYSNLSIMAGMDLHTLKLDKSIIHEIVANKKSLLITKRVIELCKDLGIEIIAEGIETEEQLSVLKELGCKYAQGYLFNKPIPAGDFETEYLGAYVR